MKRSLSPPASAAPPASLGRWYGPRQYFGLHYDLHAGADDTTLGTRCSPAELMPALRLMKPDFVQTDCKGHPGYTSWFSQVPGAAVPPGLTHDALAQWREATRQLGLPLHVHYSGIWDKAAGERHPEWCTVPADPKADVRTPQGQNAGAPKGEKMCPRGPYLEELLIPQFIELIDRYEIDGIWVDGDMWAIDPCYCPRCRAAFTAATGLVEPPVKEDDPEWPRWWNFTRESFEAYVTRYCAAVHQHKPGVLVCSNWLQSFRNPGAPTVPTDWISGDNSGFDGTRSEARFLAHRRKPWDIMLWNFHCSHGFGTPQSPWAAKSPQMLMQETATLLALGGNVQLYETAPKVRDGRLAAWRMRNLGAVGRFVKKRRALCQGAETMPQVAVLHSETHLRQTNRSRSLMFGGDLEPVWGAMELLLENHYSVDILDEWALAPRLPDYPAVVVPERYAMAETMVQALRDYVRRGGCLLLTGAELFERFGGEFLGVTAGTVEEKTTYYLSVHQGASPLYSEHWRLLAPTTAKTLGVLGRTVLTDAELPPHPAATVNRVGRGRVAYIPAAICRDFNYNHYALTRAFFGAVCRRLMGPLPISVQAPTCVDVALRRRGRQAIIHFINRLSGLPASPNLDLWTGGAVDEIPPVGPMVITVRGVPPPKQVKAAWEGATPLVTPTGDGFKITLPRLQVHEAVVFEYESPLHRLPLEKKHEK